MIHLTAGDLAHPGVRIAHALYQQDYDATVFVDSPAWKRTEGELTEEEAGLVVRALDGEDEGQSITFGSAKEALDFLRSRIIQRNV